MKFWLPLLFIIGLSVAASAATDIVGGVGRGFTGRWPVAGKIGKGSSPPPVGCAGVIDASVGCPLPMLGM